MLWLPCSGGTMRLATLLILFAFWAISDAQKLGTNPARKGKLFSLFNVVQFHNEPCASTSTVNGMHRNGTCYTSTECDDKDGSAHGNCAAGFGVCCIFIIDGNNGRTTVDNNCTYIQNDGYPSSVSTSGTESYNVNKCNDDVCFLRLDFERFTLLGTSGSNNANEGDCTDTFTINTPTGMVIPTICGENSGQHMYVDIGGNSGDTATIMITTTAANANRMWDIKVTQLECNNPNAPLDSSCLQYLQGVTGRLTSFNYENTNDNHLNQQQYSICIRQEAGFCCTEYSICPDQLGTITGGNPAGWSFDTANTKAKVDAVCTPTTIDHIGIQASGAACSRGPDSSRATNNRYCGQYFNAAADVVGNIPICDCTLPFVVDVFFNNLADGKTARGTANINTKHSRGFCLEYRQIPC